MNRNTTIINNVLVRRNVHNVSDVRQTEMHTAEPLMPGPSHLEVEIAIAKMKSINLQAMMKFRRNCSTIINFNQQRLVQ
jgi:hypothetical protein